MVWWAGRGAEVLVQCGHERNCKVDGALYRLLHTGILQLWNAVHSSNHQAHDPNLYMETKRRYRVHNLRKAWGISAKPCSLACKPQRLALVSISSPTMRRQCSPRGNNMITKENTINNSSSSTRAQGAVSASAISCSPSSNNSVIFATLAIIFFPCPTSNNFSAFAGSPR